MCAYERKRTDFTALGRSPDYGRREGTLLEIDIGPILGADPRRNNGVNIDYPPSRKPLRRMGPGRWETASPPVD